MPTLSKSLKLTIYSVISISLLTSCTLNKPTQPKKTQEQICRELQLKYDFHNGEATLWDARGDRKKAEEEMMNVVKVVMGSPMCFPEKIVQQIQYYYTTLPGVTTSTYEEEPTPSPTD